MEGDDSVLVTPFGEARLALFRGVTNAAQLRELVMAGGFGGALLDGDRVVGKLQVAAAVTKALFRTRGGSGGSGGGGSGGGAGGRGKGAAAAASGGDQRMKTKGGVASEIVFCMSPNKNVGASLKAFGIGSESTVVILVVPSNTKGGGDDDGDGDAEWQRSLAAIKGERRPVAELEAEPSQERSAAIRALYGIEDAEVGNGVGGDRPLLEAVVNSELVESLASSQTRKNAYSLLSLPTLKQAHYKLTP